jgi:hypothetical protein
MNKGAYPKLEQSLEYQ